LTDGYARNMHFTTLTLPHTFTLTHRHPLHRHTNAETNIIFMIYVRNCSMATIVAYLAGPIAIYCLWQSRNPEQHHYTHSQGTHSRTSPPPPRSYFYTIRCLEQSS